MFKEVHIDDIERRAGAPQIGALLALYRSLSADGGPPSYEAFNPEQLAEHASNLAVVEPLAGGDYLYIHYGRTIFETSGVDAMLALGAEHQKKLEDLKAKSGKDFDRSYDQMQVQAHEEAVALFEGYAASGDNPDLKSWAEMTLPHLKEHLAMAKKLS